jgi:uncharacterized protein YhaN
VDRRRLEEAHRKAATGANRACRALEKAETAWSEWQRQWQAAVGAIGLDSVTGPEGIAAQVDAIEEMRATVGKFNDLRHERIAKIERDIESFGRDVAQLAATAAPDLAALDPEEAVREMERRLAEAKRIRDLQKEKDETIAGLKQQIDDASAALRNAREEIRRLEQAAGVEDAGQLKTAIEKSDRLRALRSEQAQVLSALLAGGDGLPVADLEAECEAVDLDQVLTRGESLEQELGELRERLGEARDRRTEARKAFEAVGGDDAAARAAAQRQEALAEMREVAAQYTRVRTATLLLQWAIDRYRREKQAPLLRRASELFATLTGGSFESLRVDFDDRDQANLIGLRRDGAIVPLTGLSTGTEDQLYLALRIAAVADYLEKAAPLPFIADDLFINFDDGRAAAGFEVLGQLAMSTQVLFFTHHQHLVDIARETLGESVHVVSLCEQLVTQVA